MIRITKKQSRAAFTHLLNSNIGNSLITAVLVFLQPRMQTYINEVHLYTRVMYHTRSNEETTSRKSHLQLRICSPKHDGPKFEPRKSNTKTVLRLVIISVRLHGIRKDHVLVRTSIKWLIIFNFINTHQLAHPQLMSRYISSISPSEHPSSPSPLYRIRSQLLFPSFPTHQPRSRCSLSNARRQGFLGDAMC